MSQLSRRTFLAAGAACSTLILTGTKAWGRVLGANDTIRVGVIGLNGRGKLHIEMTTTTPGLTLAAVCDVDPAILARTLGSATLKRLDQEGQKVQGFADLREMLASKEIDAVTVATPNHWHSLAAIWAIQAGKDVLVEKPVSHNIWEGRQLANFARKSSQIVQAGTQARANPDLIEAVAWVRAGNLGKIRYAQGLCYNPRLPIGKVGHGEIPPGLDYDLWSGPVAVKPLTREKLHYDWHWIYDYGNGDLGNQGIHETDIARWFLGYEALSPRVMSIGGRLGYDDDGQTPNTQLIYHDYDGPPLIFEVRGLPKAKEFQTDKVWQKNMDSPPGFPGKGGVAVEIVAEGGKFVCVHGGEILMAVDNDGKTIRDFVQPDKRFAYAWRKGDHFLWNNWVAAMHSRKPADQKAPIEGAHLSSALGHMGMISHRLGQTMADGAILERIQGNKLAAERFESVKEHLAQNGVDLSKTPVTPGPWLTMDPKTEQFRDSPAANALARPEYRKPYTVPEVA